MQDTFDLSGKVALVTGSSRGIGAAMVRALTAHGARCVINYVKDDSGKNLTEANAVAAEIGAKAAAVIQCDVGSAPEVAALFDRIEKEHGGLDILINNAGILRDRTIKKMTIEDWEAVLRINLTGAFNCIQQATRILRPGGRIVNLSSVNAFMGFFGTANYAAAKAGLVALTKTAAREFARQQITVNAIAPGFVETEMTRGMPPEVTKQFQQQIPLGRFATADEIANAALFLCSNAAGYITGQTIHVNGGFLME
jgi:3-oxoacyl-[acyl-carrier protein] reductase